MTKMLRPVLRKFTRNRNFKTPTWSLGFSTAPAPKISDESIRIVKSTAPILAEHGYAITRTMYGRMLTENPSVKEMFNATHQIELPGEKGARQAMTLANSVYGYAANIDNLGALTGVVETIAQKHVSLHVLPEQYAVVKENLFWAMGEVLKDGVTPEVAKAWGEAYDLLAYILIERERTLREGKAAAAGGWEGYRAFEVVEKKEESSNIISFRLKPKDGGPVLNYSPGSYVAIRMKCSDGTRAVRKYSLSSSPGKDTYRISVTRVSPSMEGAPSGMISSLLHETVNVGDIIDVGVPCGDFVLDVNDTKPIVFISGGVGITPLLSMLQSVTEQQLPNSVTFMTAWKSEEAFKDEVGACTRNCSNVKVAKFFDESQGLPSEEDMELRMDEIVTDRDAHYYFCGPPKFMQKVHKILMNWKVPKSQVHFEFFGPTDSL